MLLSGVAQLVRECQTVFEITAPTTVQVQNVVSVSSHCKGETPFSFLVFLFIIIYFFRVQDL